MEELLPGYRFYPTEEELVSFYLHNKLQGKREDTCRVIPTVDIYRKEPWDLPSTFYLPLICTFLYMFYYAQLHGMHQSTG